MKKSIKILVLAVVGIAFFSSCKKHFSCNTYVKAEQSTLSKEAKI